MAAPRSTPGTDRAEPRPTLEGEESGDRYVSGMTLQLRLAEANPVSGGLRFELPEGGGTFAPGRRERKDRTRRGPITTQRRGRPANIRHQGKRR